MADSFFGFDTSLSNLNDDEGGGEPSEDEYDALNDETFGHGSDELDWEMEHEHLAEQLESSRRHNYSLDETASQLEASLSQLVLDETDAPHSRILGSSVWRNDLPFPAAPTPVPTLKNVCTVEEIERQLRQKQMQSQHQNQQYSSQNYYQPRFPPVILQRPPGLQAPVPLPFAPQQSMPHNLNQMGQPLNKLMNQSNQMGQTNQLMSNHVGQGLNQLGQNQLGQNLSQFMQNTNQFQNNQGNMMNMSQMQNVHMNQPNLLQNQLGQNVSQNMTMNQMSQNQMSQNMMQLGQNANQIGQNINQNMPLNQNVSMNQNMSKMGQNINPLGQSMGPIGQNVPQINQNVPHLSQNMPPISQTMPPMSQNQIGQNMNQMGQSMNQMGQNMNQMAPNVNQMGQTVNQMGQNVNQMMPNGNQFGQMNQFSPHSMGQPRMMAPPPGINMPRQNYSPGIGQFNPNFRGPAIKPEQQPNMHMNQQLMKPMQKINQMNQSPQNKTVTPKKVDNKPKTRVYNNSNNKNLTSQNLVQIIQNTHPILQFNNSYHNANHHPMLNRSMYSQVGLPMMNAQRQNGTYHNNSSLNGDDMGSDCDEYAGLMTQREKQWLINIQMLQLNTGTPYIHDFYYTVFLERQARKEKEGVKEAHKANQQNHPFYSGAVMQEGVPHRERHNSNRHNSTSEDGGTPRAYVPAQFENSLGKLQCGSVTAPRKIIDVEVVAADTAAERAPSRASVTTAAEAPREVKRTKQLLLDIEALYLILLRLEELNDPLAITNALILKEREEKHKQMEAAQKELENEDDDSNLFLKNIESVQRRPKQDSPKSESIDKRQVVNLAVSQKQAPVKNLLDEDKDDLVNKMYAGLLHGDRLQQMLTVRKGRALLIRFLRRAGVPTAGAACGGVRALWSRVLRALPSAARRDAAGLHALAHYYRTYIQATNGWSAIQESCAILAETLDPARTPYVLTTAFTLSAVCALVEKAAALVNTPEPSAGERQWYKFLKTLARALKHTSLPVARPGQPLPESKLVHHIRQLESRSTVEILQRGKSAELELSKAEISEQLVKYLC